MLRWFPPFQVASTCLSCSPPYLNSVVTNCLLSYYVKWPLPPGDKPTAVNKYYKTSHPKRTESSKHAILTALWDVCQNIHRDIQKISRGHTCKETQKTFLRWLNVLHVICAFTKLRIKCRSVNGTARVKYAEGLHAFHATVGVAETIYVCILEHTVGFIYHVLTAATSKPCNAHRSKSHPQPTHKLILDLSLVTCLSTASRTKWILTLHLIETFDITFFFTLILIIFPI
jgi:hypothetical protein